MSKLSAYTPEILAKELLTNRERYSVFHNLTYKGPIIGEIKKQGDVLFIAGLGRPTVRNYTPNDDITIEDAKLYNQELRITEAKYCAPQIDNVDNAQAEGEIFNLYIREAKRALAEEKDVFLAKMYTEAGQATTANTEAKSTNILATLAEAEEKLLEADVPLEEEKFLVISPAVYTKLVLAKILFQQTNADVFKKGFKGGFLNFNVFVSNSIQKTTSDTTTTHHCMAFSNRALALAEQIPVAGVKIFEQEKRFNKAFKVLNLYGGTVTRPDELVKIDIVPADETE